MANLIFGCGYLGLRVAQQWLAAGREIHVMTRSAERSAELAEIGLRPFQGDVTQTLNLPPIEPLDTVLYAVGFDRSSGKSIHDIYAHGLQRVLDTLTCPPERFIYISSTGVYGQTSGEWVDEHSRCDPRRAGGRACLAAEGQLRAHRWGSRAIILRLAGIYGPGRIPRLQALVAGDSLATAADGRLNLIHVDDAARAVLAAESRAPLPSCYVVSDGHPVARVDFYRRLAELTGAPPPRFAAAPDGSSSTERDRTDKRVSNRLMLSELEVSLRYPCYEAGLAEIVRGEK